MRVTCEVDIDPDDILDDLGDAELASYGLMRTKEASGRVGNSGTTPWHEIQRAMRQRDQARINDLISTMAWEQAGVILPAGQPILH